MKDFFKRNGLKIILVFVIIYAIVQFFEQQEKIDNYKNEISSYDEQIEDAQKEQNELLDEQKEINSIDYIESMAREKLHMYRPNEKVFIDTDK